MLMLRGQFSLTRLTIRENLTLVAFSFLFTVNIAISNVSLYALSRTYLDDAYALFYFA